MIEILRINASEKNGKMRCIANFESCLLQFTTKNAIEPYRLAVKNQLVEDQMKPEEERVYPIMDYMNATIYFRYQER